ncbi:MAG TPA: ribonuclease III, partial [Pyrodictium sp.]|nr:ribonuclease III [Pyrodictium sp.]
MKDLSFLEKRLKVSFKNKGLLIQALVHRSYLNEHPYFKYPHNERLESLGDAVLELIVSEHLYKNYQRPEGELTNWRASLVNTERISEVAKELGIESYLFLSKGEAKDTGKARQIILANTFEAIVGAIYLDQGYSQAKKFVERVLISKLPYILKHKLYLDPKTRFQEIAQAKLKITPHY